METQTSFEISNPRIKNIKTEEMKNTPYTHLAFVQKEGYNDQILKQVTFFRKGDVALSFAENLAQIDYAVISIDVCKIVKTVLNERLKDAPTSKYKNMRVANQNTQNKRLGILTHKERYCPLESNSITVSKNP